MATIAELNACCADTYMPWLNTNFGSQSIGTKLLWGKGKKISGGPMVRQTSIYQYTKGGSFVRGTVFDTSGEENALGFGVSWRYYYFPATIFLQDLVENDGPQQIHDILSVRMGAAKMGAEEKLSTDLYATGASGGIDSSTIINCLDNALNDGTTTFSTSATYAGVARSASTAWFNGNVSSGSAAALTTKMINTALSKATDGGIQPDVMLTSVRTVLTYQNLEWAKQSYVNLSQESALVAGFAMKTYHNGIPMVADVHCPSAAGTAANNRIYGINSDPRFFNFFVNSQYNMKMRPWMEPYDQAAQTTQIIHVCNILVGDPRRHFILHNYGVD